MNLNRIATAVAATVLGAGMTLMVAGAPATAAPATGPSPVTACDSVGGDFSETAGTWSCEYNAVYGADPQVLVDWCFSQDYNSSMVIDGPPNLVYRFACTT